MEPDGCKTLQTFQHDLREACGAFDVSGLVDCRARVATTQVAGLEAVDINLGSSRIERSARSARADHMAHYFLVRQVSGTAMMEQAASRSGSGMSIRTGPATVRAGDFFLASSRSAATFLYSGRARQLSVHLPYEPVRQLVGHEVAGGVHLSAGGIGARSLSRALARAEADPHAAPDLPDLLAVILHNGAEPDLDLVEAACVLTQRRARDPRFSPARLAELLGVELRTLQRALARRKMSASGIILQERLTRARRLLRQSPQKAVLSCATEAGFGDISAFNRVFRREYGMTPGAFRQQYCRD